MASLCRPLVTLTVRTLHTKVLVGDWGPVVQCAVQSPGGDSACPEGLIVVPN